jgi:hypothetical protein
MPLVRDTLLRPNGTPITQARIEVRLYLGSAESPGYNPGTETEILGYAAVSPDDTGLWSIELPANTTLRPSNTYYQAAIVVPGQAVDYETFIVPDGAGPFWLYDILAVAPAAGPQPAAYLTTEAPLPLGPTALIGTDSTAAHGRHVHAWTGLPYDAAGAAAAAVTAHLEDEDPHPQYLMPAAADLAYDALGAATTAVATHVGLADPHPSYLNTTRGDLRYDLSGAATAVGTAAATALATHAALTLAVHGIADTAQLARLNVVQTFTAKQTFSAPISADRTIDLSAPQSAGMQAVFNRTNPPVASPQAFWNIGAMVNSQGAWLSNAWMVISGTAPGSPNAAGIYEPQQPSSDQFMLGIWSDIVGPALVTRTNPTSTPGYNYQAHDRNGNYVFSVEEDGTLKWGATDRAGMGTSLYRSAVATLRTPGTLAIDTLLTFPTSGTRSLITARNQGNSATLVALSVDASNNLVIGDGATPWAGVLVNKSKLTLQGSAATGWQSATAFYGGDANNNSGATADFAIGSGLAGGRLYAGRWSSTDRGTRLVSLNSVGAEKTYLHLNGEGGSVALGVGIGSTAGNGTDRIKVDGTGIGFFAATPVAKPTLAAAATDLATALTLVNDIRTRLINYGLAA